MLDFLKAIDIYGSKFSLNIDGKSTNKTILGGFATIISAVLLVLVTVLFGDDFFFRLNPRIVSQKAVATSSELIVPTTSNFTVAFRVEDYSSNFVDLPKIGVKVTATYYYYVKDDQGVASIKNKHRFELKRCYDIPAVKNNEIDQNYNLQQYYCVDWDEVADFVPFLGGYWDEDKIGYLTLHLNNCSKKGGEDCASVKKLRELLKNEFWYFSVVYPNYFFDTDSFDSPIKTYFEANPLEVSAYTRIVQEAKMQIATLTDDTGWIFKDEKIYAATSIEHLHGNFSSIVDDDIGDFKLFEYSIYFGKVSAKMYRSFIKIQELAAEVGGIIKLLHISLSFVVNYYSNFDMMRKLVINSKNEQKEIVRFSESNAGINNVSAQQRKAPCINISFLSYCLRLFYKKKTIEYTKEATKIKKTFDVKYLLRVFKEERQTSSLR